MEPGGSWLCSQHRATLFQMNPIHALSSFFLNIHFNIILPYTTGSYKRPRSLRFPHLNTACTSPSAPRLLSTCPAHLILCRLNTEILVVLGEECVSWSSSFSYFPQSCATSFLLGPKSSSALYSLIENVWGECLDWREKKWQDTS